MKNYSIKKIFSIAIVFSAWASNAQSKVWTLEECVSYAMENNIVQHINSFFPFKNKIFVHFFSGIRNSHFLFLDNNFDVIYHVDELENDFDGMKLNLWSWAYSENEIVYYEESGRFYNDYVETFKDTSKTMENGGIHDFFRNNKEKLKEEKHVLVVMKVKE